MLAEAEHGGQDAALDTALRGMADKQVVEHKVLHRMADAASLDTEEADLEAASEGEAVPWRLQLAVAYSILEQSA